MFKPILRSPIRDAVKSVVPIYGGLSATQELVQLLFSNNEQGVFYVPQPVVDDQQVLFTDAAGTTPVTADGDMVGLMLDLSGNGNHASQSVSLSRPKYRTDGVLHWLEGDGVDDYFDMPMTPFRSTTTPSSALAAIKTETIAFSSLTCTSSGSYFLLSKRDDTSTIISNGFTAKSYRVNGASVNNLTRDKLYSSFAAGAVAGTLSFTADQSSGHSLLCGRTSSGRAYYFGGKFYGWVERQAVFNLSETDNVEKYLAQKSGVTLP